MPLKCDNESTALTLRLIVGVVGTTVLVVQHGEKVRAPGDPGLTARGMRQACAIAESLLASGTLVSAVWASPMRRAQETAAPIAAAFGLTVRTEGRLRERMNWEGESSITGADFLVEWEKASEDVTYEPAVGDSSAVAADRFLSALIEISRSAQHGAVVAVAHGGVTVDALRRVAGDDTVKATSSELIADGVPCGAVTTYQVDGDSVSVVGFPTVVAPDEATQHRPV